MATKYIDLKGKERAGTAAIKEYMSSDGHEEVKIGELKALMPSVGGPGTGELSDLCAIELGWKKVEPK